MHLHATWERCRPSPSLGALPRKFPMGSLAKAALWLGPAGSGVGKSAGSFAFPNISHVLIDSVTTLSSTFPIYDTVVDWLILQLHCELTAAYGCSFFFFCVCVCMCAGGGTTWRNIGIKSASAKTFPYLSEQCSFFSLMDPYGVYFTVYGSFLLSPLCPRFSGCAFLQIDSVALSFSHFPFVLSPGVIAFSHSILFAREWQRYAKIPSSIVTEEKLELDKGHP